MPKNYKNNLNNLLEKLDSLDDLTWFYIFYEALKQAYPTFVAEEVFKKLSDEQIEELLNLMDKVGNNYRLESKTISDKS
jgi:hypothetical protein